MYTLNENEKYLKEEYQNLSSLNLMASCRRLDTYREWVLNDFHKDVKTSHKLNSRFLKESTDLL